MSEAFFILEATETDYCADHVPQSECTFGWCKWRSVEAHKMSVHVNRLDESTYSSRRVTCSICGATP